MFLFCDNLVIFDHVSHSLKIVSHLRVPVSKCNDEKFIQEEYETITSRILETKLKLNISNCQLPHQGPILLGQTAKSRVEEKEYSEFVEKLKHHIVEGDIFQTVPSRRLVRPTTLHPFNAYRELRSINPSPYMFYLDMGQFQIVGASPEMFAKVENGRVFTHPIAGTRKRGQTSEEDDYLEKDLLSDKKEISEHVMLVDLGRNDINRICQPNTVKVDSLMHIERYSHVMHIVSNVSGDLRQSKTRFDAFRSIFPAGTLSGAPKVRAMELISDLEKTKRGVYGGAVGYFDYCGGMDTCIAIRTMLFKNGTAFLQAGGGIVHDSNPSDEYKETVNKLASNLTAIERAEQFYVQHQDETKENVILKGQDQGQSHSHSHSPPTVESQGISQAITISQEFSACNDGTSQERPTLLIDNYDSFTWNVYQYLSLFGANVKVFRNDKISLEECIALNPVNVVISPGPGKPSDSGISIEVIKHFAGKVPILGICLGEQCMVEIFGGKVIHAPEIVHGRTSVIHHDGEGVYKGLGSSIECTRYHSLVGQRESIPDQLKVTSWTENNLIMGVRHKKYTIEGVQFHPESILSEQGKKMIKNFLQLRGGVWSDVSLMNISELKPKPAITKNKSILSVIQNERIKEINTRKKIPGRTESQLKKMIELGLAKPVQPITKRIRNCVGKIAIMAEIKRASPSKGDINTDACAPEEGLLYAEAGAAVISVLTEPNHFKGSLQDLTDVRNAINLFGSARPSVLCKDFIVDSYQIYEARLAGADSILLIVAILEIEKLRKFMKISREVGMEPLVEVNGEAELDVALEAGARLIGVNNRNLHTFEVNMNTTTLIARKLKKINEQVQSAVVSDRHTHRRHSIILCALSGIKSSVDVQEYIAEGVQAALIGEALMLTTDKRAFISSITSPHASLSVEHSSRMNTNLQVGAKTLVKICGVRSVDEALFAARRGADFIGLVFAESRRKVDKTIAKDVINAIRKFSVDVFSHEAESRPSSPYYKYNPSPSPTGSRSHTPGDDLRSEAANSSLLDWYQDQATRVAYDLVSKRRPFVVGVFADQDPKQITTLARELDLDFVQLHGSESLQDTKFIMERVNVIRVLKVDGEKSWNEPEAVSKELVNYVTSSPAQGEACKLSSFTYIPKNSAFHILLLDTAPNRKTTQQGGHGKSFNWAVTQGLVEKNIPFILAGGLRPESVREAITMSKPWMVDVSSGVEKEDASGKDYDKMSRFIESVKGI
jgi:anthranilate synthase/indole-3-glycerol phosphate synthase/phosphoribosylanthranilate isomerase